MARSDKAVTEPAATTETPARERQAAKPAIETIRIECLKLAVELRSATVPNATVIKNAQEFEAYVTGEADEPPAEEA